MPELPPVTMPATRGICCRKRTRFGGFADFSITASGVGLLGSLAYSVQMFERGLEKRHKHVLGNQIPTIDRLPSMLSTAFAFPRPVDRTRSRMQRVGG
jgi:hypothetical protein